jgi:hypothetical protein
MKNNEKTEKNKEKHSFLAYALLFISALSCAIGIIAGSSVTKAYYKHKIAGSDKKFDADEYVRSLNLD